MSDSIKKIGIPTLAVASALALAILATSMLTPAFAAISSVDVSCQTQEAIRQEVSRQHVQVQDKHNSQRTKIHQAVHHQDRINN